MDFHQTGLGSRFFNMQVPALIEALQRLAATKARPSWDALERQALRAALRTLVDVIQQEELAGHFPRETLLLVEELLKEDV